MVHLGVVSTEVVPVDFAVLLLDRQYVCQLPLLLICLRRGQGRTDTVAPVARATVNFPSESSVLVYRKVYPVSRETLAAYSL